MTSHLETGQALLLVHEIRHHERYQTIPASAKALRAAAASSPRSTKSLLPPLIDEAIRFWHLKKPPPGKEPRCLCDARRHAGADRCAPPQAFGVLRLLILGWGRHHEGHKDNMNTDYSGYTE